LKQGIHLVAVRLADLEVWLVGLVVVGSLVTSRLLPLALVVAALFWVIRWIATGRLSSRSVADWPIGIMALLLPLNLWASALPERTLTQLFRLLSGIALYFAILNWTNTHARLRWLVVGVIVAGLILALSAPFSVEWAVQKLSVIPEVIYNRFKVVVPDPVHPNVMAGSLVILLPVPAAILLFGWRWLSKWIRVLCGTAILVMLGILFLTQSRGAWIALAVVVLLMVTLRWRWGWITIPTVVILGAIFVNGLGTSRSLDILTANGSISGMDGRAEIWSRAIYLVQDFPLTGLGMGLFGEAVDQLYPFLSYPAGSVPHAHNLFLQVAVDLGIPGLIAWLAVLGVIVVSAWQVYTTGRRSRDAKVRDLVTGLGVGLICSQLALIAHGMTDAVTWGMVRPAPLVWVLWGLTAASINYFTTRSDGT
jgi:putative inorganic carbon (HCO3(-)) transporter